jgi:hypothetical protein
MIDKKVIRKRLARAQKRASEKLDKTIESGDLNAIRNELIECGSSGYQPDEAQAGAILALEKAAREAASKKKGAKNVKR